jgi:hypothetical protein
MKVMTHLEPIDSSTQVPRSPKHRWLRTDWHPRWNDFVSLCVVLTLGITELHRAHGQTFPLVFGVVALALSFGYATAIALRYLWERAH